MKSFEHITLLKTSTIKDALTIIDSGAMRIAVVIDRNAKLIGTVTDGDVRRGLLKGLSLTSPIEPIIHQTPVVCRVNDSKEDILRIAIEKKLYQIPVVDKDGVLIGVNEVDELLKPTEYSNKVVLMVGGLGTRLGSLTENCPKPLLEVGDKPILETIILAFAKYGFKNIILSVNYKAKMIENYFGDGSKIGVHIEYIHEQKRMGTAGALSFLKRKLNEPFFVMNGDLLTNVNFEHMLEYHLSNAATATMCVRKYDFEVPYGVVNLEENDIINIDEKPVHKCFVNGGIYVLNTDALNYIPDNVFYDMPTLFELMIKNKEKVVSFPIREYWLDIGHIPDLQQAKIDYSEYF